jgi:2-polyprenyl-6-methoxyphenol hydroxylase-like FAD-dependent oxidoreductase
VVGAGPLTADLVRVHARVAGDVQTFTGRLVLGCDGAHSIVRELAGITMEDRPQPPPPRRHSIHRHPAAEDRRPAAHLAALAPPVVNGRRTTATISPAMSTVIARRMAGARQPSHRCYRVGAGTPVIV